MPNAEKCITHIEQNKKIKEPSEDNVMEYLHLAEPTDERRARPSKRLHVSKDLDVVIEQAAGGTLAYLGPLAADGYNFFHAVRR